MGRMSKSDKEYFSQRVPYDISLLNNFDGYGLGWEIFSVPEFLGFLGNI